MSVKKGYWQTRDGDVMPIKDMSDNHLQNAIAMLVRIGRTDSKYPKFAELVAEERARNKGKKMKQTTLKDTKLGDRVQIYLTNRLPSLIFRISGTKTETAIPATVIGIEKDDDETYYYLGWTEDQPHPIAQEMTVIVPAPNCEWVSNRKDFAYYDTIADETTECEIIHPATIQPTNAPKQKVEWVDGTYGEAKLGDKVRVYLTKDGMVAKRKTTRSVEATVIARDHKEDTYSYSMALGWASWQERPVDAIENLEGNEYDEQLPNDHKDYAWCHNTVHFKHPCQIRQTTVEEKLPGFPQTELPSKLIEIPSIIEANDKALDKYRGRKDEEDIKWIVSCCGVSLKKIDEMIDDGVDIRALRLFVEVGETSAEDIKAEETKSEKPKKTATNTIYLATVLVHKPTNVLDTGTVVIYELIVDGLTSSNMHLLHSILDVIKTVEHRGDIEVHSFGMHAKEEHAFEEISDRYQTLKVKHYDPYASMITLRVSLGSGGLSIAPMPDPYMVEIDDDNYAMKRGEKIIENSLDEKKWCLPIIRSMQVPQDKSEIDMSKVKAYVDLPTTINKHKHDMLFSTNAPVRHRAQRIQELILAGELSTDDFVLLIGDGLDPEVIRLWQEVYVIGSSEEEPKPTLEEPKETTSLGTAAMLVGGAIGGAIMGAIGKACLNEMPSVRVIDDSAAIETITVPVEQCMATK